MKRFTFKVTRIENYEAKIEIEAENEQAARENGLSLLFFVVSSFWMFLPNTTVFKKGLYLTLSDVVLTLILIFI